MRSMRAALAAKEKLKNMLRGTLGVSGIAVAKAEDGQPGLRVNIEPPRAGKDLRKLPEWVDDFPVQVVYLHEATFHHQARRGA